jgi:GT2 family glycosyltransferase
MNAGAAAASGDVFLFLHADVTLEQPAYETMLDALRDPALAGGAFRRRFDSPSRLLRLGCRLADLRGTRLRIFLGDQAIFVRPEAFRALGGFPKILLFEDLEFSRKLAGQGRTVLLKGVVVASSRRFDRGGNFRQMVRNLGLTALYFAGADPGWLARRYYPALYPSLRSETGGEAPAGTAGGGGESATGKHTGASRGVVG